ncbi:MAG TPA: RibD family protein [Polyangiaceae bacterium]|nr:RibD family protein [Polyangiaceae bacterium]
MMLPAARTQPLDTTLGWVLIRELLSAARDCAFPPRKIGVSLDHSGRLEYREPEASPVWVEFASEPGFGYSPELSRDVQQMLELYLPLCVGRSAHELVLAHMGQSLDGQIATATGDSRYITGRENLEHVHRLRALCDAVMVGADTADLDDPKLTTRLVPGQSPVRVVIDPELRVSRQRALFTDGAPTFVVCRAGAVRDALGGPGVEFVEVEPGSQRMSAHAIVGALRARGLRRLFIEGGGVTVSRFLHEGALDRLHLTVSPVFVGQGRPGVALPPLAALSDALRPSTRHYPLGPDVLFDCALKRRPWLPSERRTVSTS